MTAVLEPTNGESKLTPGEDHRHRTLRAHPKFWSCVGISQTLLTAGIVFGWASLLPIVRDEGTQCTSCTVQEFSFIFTCGAIGNYMSTLFFGTTLDRYGPRMTAILASILFSLGLVLCSIADDSSRNLLIGFGLLGFSGPGVQMPTLHLANLFPGAVYMSSQAAAFDGGTFVFAVARTLSYQFSISTAFFFRCYLIVPLSVLATAVFVWPDTILQGKTPVEENDEVMSPYVGASTSSPAISNMSIRSSIRSSFASLRNLAEAQNDSLVDAPLNTVLMHRSFWTLAVWTGIHILKLNFIVASINDQLQSRSIEPERIDSLIDIFGTMLPFGFVVLPVVASLLHHSPMWAFQLANMVGVAYGCVLLWFPSNKWLLSLIVFPSVATCRQLVYSTVFHQIGELFGFANYGTLLGLTNVLVSAFSCLQTPLVSLSEQNASYTVANTILLLLTLPLFFFGLRPEKSSSAKVLVRKRRGARKDADEATPLVF